MNAPGNGPGNGPSDPLSLQEQVVEATYQCIARFGISKTTVEDVVRASGVSRASIYRYFPGGRDQLVRETVGREIGRFLTDLGDQVRNESDLAVLLARALRLAHQAVREHDLLQTILRTEPERLLGLLTTEATRSVPFIAAFLEPYLEREVAAGRLRDGVSPQRAADYLARMFVTYLGASGRWDLEDAAQLDDLVRHELLGGVLR